MEKQQKTNFFRNARYLIYVGAQRDLRGCLCAPKSSVPLKMSVVIICYSVKLLISWEDTIISCSNKNSLSAASEHGIICSIGF